MVRRIRDWGQELGFASIGIASVDVSAATPWLMRWLELGRHGEMDYMAKHAACAPRRKACCRAPVSVISVRLPYWPDGRRCPERARRQRLAYVSRYALGRDYHKTIRGRLQKLIDRLRHEAAVLASGRALCLPRFLRFGTGHGNRVRGPAGVAWRGKHTLSLTREGSWHFLGEIYTTLPLPSRRAIGDHCGDCRRCLDACPTAAIVAPYEVDARLCISYLTIELQGAIPVALRPLIGNRIYGCDDCQLCCPWNRFAHIGDPDFAVRNGLDATPLTALFAWSEEEFNTAWRAARSAASATSAGCAISPSPSATPPPSPASRGTGARQDDPSPLLREHVGWALAQHAPAPGGEIVPITDRVWSALPPGCAQALPGG
jgi:epoxyqueuosine reductase